MTRLLVLAVTAISVTVAAIAPATADDASICFKSDSPANAALAACGRLISSGQYKDGGLGRVHSWRGLAYLRRGDHDRAITDYNEAIRLDPKNASFYGGRGVAFARKGGHDRAIADYSEAIRLDPKYADAYAARGEIYVDRGEIDRAIRDLDEAVRLKVAGPKLPNVYFNRGVIYARKGDHDRALRDFNETIRLAPKNASSFAGRGKSYLGKGDLDRAIADFNEAIRLDPKYADAYLDRGQTYQRKKEYDRAISDLDEAIRLDLKSADVYNERGAALFYKGEYDRAIADINEAIRLDPKNASGYNNRGFAFASKDDHDRAIADYSEAIRLDPKQHLFYKNLGLSFERKGNLTAALVNFRQAMRLAPDYTEALDGTERVDRKLASAAPAPAIADLPPAPSAASVPAGSRVALVIGNGDYRHATKLSNPTNDAADLAQALRKLGFDVVEGRDLDRRGMEDKVREFGRKLDNAGLALFFYAGHGMQVGGRNYLLPVDSKLERQGDLNFETVDVGNVLAQMEAEKRVNLVFLDACRDNPLSRSFARSLGTRSASVGQGLASIQSAIGTMIAYATQPDAVALDGDGRNSPFTTALLKHISTPGLDIGVLMRRVRTDVIAATRQKQVPWDHSSLTGEVVLAR